MSGYFKDKEPKELKARLPLLYVAAALGMFAVLVRMWHLQVMEADYFRELSRNNRLRLVKTTAPRGLIYDRNGIRLVENRPGFDLMLVPEDVTDWDRTEGMLEKLAGIDPSVVREKVKDTRGRAPFSPVRLKEDMTWEETAKVESFKFEMPGVNLDVSPKRSYLYGTALAHLVGYLGEISEGELRTSPPSASYDPGDMVGRFGLERSLEEYLRGVDGGEKVEVDALGRRVRVETSTPPQPGNSVTLTIDLKTQIAAWSELRDTAGAAVAIEPSTGKVLAMVSTPSFDPNALSTGISRRDWKALVENPLDILTNRATQGQYPPASTFKPVAAAAALEEGVISPSTEIYSGPTFTFVGRDYRDWKEEGHGDINVHRAIVESSDTFFYQVGLELGVDNLAKYSKSFGLGSKTGIDLLSEKPGLVPSSQWKKNAYGVRWYRGETISVSVGQGYMLATPLQLAVAYAAMANGGTVYKPLLIEDISTHEGGLLRKYQPVEAGRVNVSQSTMRLLRNALRGVVHEEGGTARALAATDLRIAGKTGTAQVAKLMERVDDIEEIPYKFRDHAWFAGFAPYDDPKIAVVVLVEHGGFGAAAAAPIAGKIFEAYLASPPVPGTDRTTTAALTPETAGGGR